MKVDNYTDEITALRFLFAGNHDSARAFIRQMSKEQLLKLSDALDYYAVLVDEQLIRYARTETS